MSEVSQAEDDARTAWTYAINCVIVEEDQRSATDGRSPDEVMSDYAADVFRELGGDPDRLYAAARLACIKAAEVVAYPGRWRTSLRAVELCQRAALLAQPPVSRAG